MPPPYSNDPSIQDSIDVYRRIHSDQVFFDKNLNRVRPSSAAFDDFELSVYFPQLLQNLGKSAQDILTGRSLGSGVAAIGVGLLRSFQQAVCYDPDKNDSDIGAAHGLAVGKKDDKCDRKLALRAVWVIEGVPFNL